MVEISHEILIKCTSFFLWSAL